MTNRLVPTPTRAWLPPLAAALMAGSVAALAGCTSKIAAVESGAAVPDDYRINHPIAVTEAVQTLDVPVALYSNVLNEAMRANVVFFAQRFVKSGSNTIAVVAPSGSPNQTVAAGIAVQIEDVLKASGVPPKSIDYRVYHAASDETNAPIRVAYSAISAATAPCLPYPDQLAVNRENRHYFNYGCSTQQNLAAMVDNPLDLLYPRGLTPADAARRADVLQKYRTGNSTGADHSREAGAGTVATGVGQ